jgi:hypothetical protein
VVASRKGKWGWGQGQGQGGGLNATCNKAQSKQTLPKQRTSCELRNGEEARVINWVASWGSEEPQIGSPVASRQPLGT